MTNSNHQVLNNIFNMENSDFNHLKYKTISYPHERCQCSSPEGSLSILLTALHMVKEVVCSAEEYIGGDILEIFYYKYPKKLEVSDSACSTENTNIPTYSSDSYIRLSLTGSSDSVDEIDSRSGRRVTMATTTGPMGSGDEIHGEYARHPDHIVWPMIGNFNLQNCAIKIRDYIDLWKLTPNTKFSVLMKDQSKLFRNKGARFFVDAMFSSPTPKCPNPLAVARVHFYIQVPELMPKYYPVMITYRFEGFKSIYHAVGRKQVRSLEFQRFFIDTILHTKLKFYAELFQCRYSMENCSMQSMSEATEEDSPHKCATRKLLSDDKFTSSDL